MRAILFVVFMAYALSTMAQSKSVPIVLGRTESVKLMDNNIKIDAKMDTGAFMSSLHADAIEEFSKDGKEWIKFTFKDRLTGKVHEIQKMLVRNVRIKKRSGEIKSDGNLYMTRPVVKLSICIAGREKIIDVNLTNRDHFKQKMLIGRKSMNLFSVIINPSKEFLTIPDCK